jgi:hypothetical protein
MQLSQVTLFVRHLGQESSLARIEDLIVDAVFAQGQEQIDLLRRTGLTVVVEGDSAGVFLTLSPPVKFFADQPETSGFSDADDPWSAARIIAGTLCGFSSMSRAFPTLEKRIAARQKEKKRKA